MNQHDADLTAGNFNKSLLRRDTLADIVKVVSEARDLHASMSLTWGDNGDRVLPAMLFEDYAEKMHVLRRKFDERMASLKAPGAGEKLNSMFDKPLALGGRVIAGESF